MMSFWKVKVEKGSPLAKSSQVLGPKTLVQLKGMQVEVSNCFQFLQIFQFIEQTYFELRINPKNFDISNREVINQDSKCNRLCYWRQKFFL